MSYSAKEILSLFIILSILTASIITIPADISARRYIYMEESERLGEPGDDPTITTNPLSGGGNSDITVAASNENMLDKKEVSLLELHLKITFNQLIGLIF